MLVQLGALREVRGDAPAVAALRAAGAVLLGKANLHEVGVGMTGLNLAHGTPRNPHDPTRFCGGSSSGCAAAVAAGMCVFAIGASPPVLSFILPNAPRTRIMPANTP